MVSENHCHRHSSQQIIELSFKRRSTFFTMANGISILYLVTFGILSLPLIYVLIRHGKRGILGWLSLSTFCTIRAVGNGLQLLAEQNDDSNLALIATIVSSLGLSPLLMGIAGILDEAYVHPLLYLYFQSLIRVLISRHHRLRQRFSIFEWFLVLNAHGIAIAGSGLIGAGFEAFDPTVIPTSTDINLVKSGIIVIMIAWFAVSTLALFWLLPISRDAHAKGYKDGSNVSPWWIPIPLSFRQK